MSRRPILISKSDDSSRRSSFDPRNESPPSALFTCLPACRSRRGYPAPFTPGRVSSLQRDPREGAVDADWRRQARVRRATAGIRVTPVIRTFVTWSCRVDSPISSGRPGEGYSHVRRLPPPRPTTSTRDTTRGRYARVSRRVEERRIQGDGTSRSETDYGLGGGGVLARDFGGVGVGWATTGVVAQKRETQGDG